MNQIQDWVPFHIEPKQHKELKAQIPNQIKLQVQNWKGNTRITRVIDGNWRTTQKEQKQPIGMAKTWLEMEIEMEWRRNLFGWRLGGDEHATWMVKGPRWVQVAATWSTPKLTR